MSRGKWPDIAVRRCEYCHSTVKYGEYDSHLWIIHGQQSALANQLQENEMAAALSGKLYLVVCNGNVYEVDDEKRALIEAEKLAHQHQTDVVIYRGVSRVSPKRDVTVTPIA